MQVKPQTAIAEVMAKATHHQRGVGFSTAPEMRLVTQSKLRLFRTSGTRASGGITSAEASPRITSGVVAEPSIARIRHLTMSPRAPQTARDDTVVDWSAPSWPGLRLRFSFVMFQCGVPALLL